MFCHLNVNSSVKLLLTNKRLDSIERKIDSNAVNAMSTKPQVLLFSTIEAIQMFTKDNAAAYDETVRYFKFLNCITLKDSVHQCMKEAITTQVVERLTWWGVNANKVPFYNTVLCQAIYQAVASNQYYPKPTREEFQRAVVGSLKVAKQQIRNARGRHPGIQENRKNLKAAAYALYNEDVGNHEDDRNQPENENNNNALNT
ncbi:uncharacterized protein [Temnothorax nylanderi]|uniref:uncharacterized protein n=1 Tax=Temnothorax nylanderi TaxID=102681 RepID=UPI003A8A635A